MGVSKKIQSGNKLKKHRIAIEWSHSVGGKMIKLRNCATVLFSVLILLLSSCDAEFIEPIPQATTVVMTPSSTATQPPSSTPTITPTSTSTPVPIPAVVSLSAGEYNTCVLLDTGTIKCWGMFSGDAMFGSDMLPLNVTYQAMDIGRAHACGLTTDGRVFCWGTNRMGELGNGSVDTFELQPGTFFAQEVVGLSEKAIAIAAGGRTSCALMESGALKCWGLLRVVNNDGTVATMATEIPELSNEVTAIAGGFGYTCVLLKNGGVECWGLNKNGQLGNGSYTDSDVPVSVVGLTDAFGLAAGVSHTCALVPEGVMCWGDNQQGQLGNGGKSNQNKPAPVKGIGGGIRSITAGETHTCVLRTDGAAACWGSNDHGQLGNGDTQDHVSPVEVQDMGSKIMILAAGYRHTCAVTVAGGVFCWGENEANKLGLALYRATPGDVVGLASTATMISAGRSHTCALLTDGKVQCWGDNLHGQLGDDTHTGSDKPKTIPGLAGVDAISAGEEFTCALAGGGLKCWGDDAFARLGEEPRNDNYLPGVVSGLTGDVAAISAGEDFACVLTTDGGVKCWGENPHGELGDGTIEDRYTPAEVTGLISGVLDVSSGETHACALLSGGGVECWGENFHGELGDGTNNDSSVPVGVLNLQGKATAIAVGGSSSCAIIDGGGVMCWGTHHDRSMGGNISNVPVPIRSLETGVIAITAGWNHICVLTDQGGVYCWGDNSSGQVGTQLGAGRSAYIIEIPIAVEGLTSGVAAIDAGYSHTCVLLSGGGVKCWGSNFYGQLGDGYILSINDGFSPDPIPVDYCLISFENEG